MGADEPYVRSHTPSERGVGVRACYREFPRMLALGNSVNRGNAHLRVSDSSITYSSPPTLDKYVFAVIFIVDNVARRGLS
jgi:hypothetical protein